MDLRPHLSESFALLAFEVFEKHDLIDGDAVEQEQLQEAIAEAKTVILQHFTSYSLDFPNGEIVSTEDPGVAEQFLAKYPMLQEYVDLAKEEANKRFDNPEFILEVHSDPEGCHICHEAQHLVLAIETGLDFYNEDGEYEGGPFDLADDAWMDFLIDDDSPWWKLASKHPGMSHLIRTELRWAPTEGEE